MPARPGFEPKKHKTGWWYIYVPKAYSDTPKAQRLYFKTKSEATDKSNELKSKVESYGKTARFLNPKEMEAVARILEVIEPYGKDLTEVVQEWIQMQQGRGRLMVRELAEDYLVSLRDVSQSHRKTVESWVERVSGKFGNTMVRLLMPRVFERWLEEETKTDQYFNLVLRSVKPMFNWGVKSRLIDKNPIEHVYPKRIIRDAPSILTVEQACWLLAACQDYRRDKKIPEYVRCDARKALVPVAVLLFAGIRPEELTRLTWDDVFLSKDLISVPAKKSKTGTLRHVHIEPNLKMFLELVSEGDRIGKIIPSNWVKIWKAVRYAAGISGMQDVCRHSYATYWLVAHDNDMNGLLSNMGHTTSKITLKHYLTASEKPDAIAFFNIRLYGPCDKEGIF